MLTNDVVSFEQLGPDLDPSHKVHIVLFWTGKTIVWEQKKLATAAMHGLHSLVWCGNYAR